MATSTHHDPRSIITPDAFEVSEDLIGMPLASPRRRAAALMIDGVVIGLITAVTKSFALILGVVAAAFFMRAGFKRTKVRNSVFGRAMRVSVGCLGIVIAMITASLWIALGPSFGGEDSRSSEEAVSGVVSSAGTVFTGLQAAALAAELSEAGSIDEAESLAGQLVRLARAGGWDEESLRAALFGLPPEDQEWSAEWAETVERLLAEGADRDRIDVDRGAAADARARAADLSDEEALTTYAALLEEPGSDPVYRTALERRLSPVVASDTLFVLETRSEELSRRLEASEQALATAQEDLAEASEGGLFGWLRDRLDELGFGFGWAALYMSVFLSWWNGQTVGKRLMGVRVVRLDGEAITWWTAFERAGGYAAGLATGLLGFAQVWWDANRQAIHDRIVGTVVVREGAQKVVDWESAL